MLKNLLSLLAISPIISNQVTSPYLSINQFVIFNNITDINLSLDNPQTSRGQYVFNVDINQDDEYMYLLNDSKGLYFENSVNGSIYYLVDYDNQFINGNVNQFITWSDYFYSNTLGLNFDNLRNAYIDSFIENIDYENFYNWFVSQPDDYDYFGYGSYLVQLHEPYSDSTKLAFKNVFNELTYYYDVSIGLNNYTYSPYANYNFEFTGYANASIGDYGPLVSIQGSESGSFHPTNNQLSNGRLIINITNLSNLDYMSQYVLEDYPFYETLQYYTNQSFDINKVLSENESLRNENNTLRQLLVDNTNNPMQNLIWTVAATPWESFKNIWNVNVLGVNIARTCYWINYCFISYLYC